MKDKILVIDDNVKICDLIKKFGEKQYNYDIDVVYSINEALECLRTDFYSLITLDIELKGESGLERIDDIQREFQGPILFVSCVSDIDTIIQGFNHGADDYITKPFDLDELFLRVKRSVDRVNNTRYTDVENYTIDEIKERVVMDGHKLELSEIAFKILIYLLKNSGQVVTREDIFKNVWAADYTYSTRVIDTHISYIRKETNDIRIKSVRSKGYIFES